MGRREATMAPGEVVVIDCAGHMLGRLASIIAKQLLYGQKVVAVRCEKITVSGGFVRQKMKYERFRRKRHLTAPRPQRRSCGGLLEEWSHTRPSAEPPLWAGSSPSRASHLHMTRRREWSSPTRSRFLDF